MYIHLHISQDWRPETTEPGRFFFSRWENKVKSSPAKVTLEVTKVESCRTFAGEDDQDSVTY